MSMLGIGTSALSTAQTSLATTSHNISNINTEGYSRQRVDQATRPADFAGQYYTGSGAYISDVNRIFDEFLSGQVRSYTSQESQQDTYFSYSKQVDDLLGSPELGLNTGIESFFNSVHEVSNNPTSVASRQVMVSEGKLLANRFNTLDQQLASFQKQLDSELTVAVSEINMLSEGIGNLNQAIVERTSAGTGLPNDLMDQRDNLIDQLSKFVKVSTINEGNGSVSVFIGSGQSLVIGSNATKLSVIDDTSVPPKKAVGYGLADIDISSQLSGGIIGGVFQTRDEVLAAALTDLNTLAYEISDAVNVQHQAGLDLDGNAGGLFFTDLSAVPVEERARQMAMSLSDPRLLAASSVAGFGVGNNENALALANLQTDKIMAGGTQTFAGAYGVIVANVATRTHQAEIGQKTQEGLLNQVKSKFDSISGVNLDEEAANLIKYQQSYQAAAQIITVSNTIFNTLISSM